jgi:hypothetical protein
MADYDISNVPRRVVYAASGVGPYAFTFEILDETDIAVYKASTLLTLTTDYTVTINADGTGEVDLVATAGTSNITIVGAKNIQRTTDFTTGGDLFADALNDELDNQTIFIQQVAETAERGLKAPVTDPTDIAMTLPAKASRAGKTLAFDANGNPVVGEDIGNWRGNWASGTSYTVRDLVKDASNYNVYRCNTAHTASGTTPISSNADSAKWDLVIDAEYAADQADAAAASAVEAQTAETNAETAETNAETAATNAANSASAASTSATNASNSATAASTSATNSANSATASASSASAASTSATNASNSASAASTSATNAANSATAASGSASTASTQATNASNSASAASTSATNASNSASAASTSATNAQTAETNAETAQAAAETAQAGAEAALEAFNETYLGAKSSDPSVDNNGDPVTAGDWYFNTTTSRSRIYTGSAWENVIVDTTTVVSKTGNTGSAIVPSGSTAQRDGSPSNGYFRYNSDLDSFEGYVDGAWGGVGGAQAGGVIYENSQTVTSNYTITTGKNGFSVGPITIDSGVTVTVPSGSVWTII